MIAKVIIDRSNNEIDRCFEYLVPSDISLQVGQRVNVDFANCKSIGFCIGLSETPENESFKLKEIISIFDEEILISQEMFKLMEFMKSKFHIRYIDALRLFLPNEYRTGKIKIAYSKIVNMNTTSTLLEILDKIPKRCKAQIEAINFIAKNDGVFYSELTDKFSSTVINSLAEKGFVYISVLERYRQPHSSLQNESNEVVLKDSQVRAIKEINASTKTVVLLHGVTGSGKTEVYIKLIEKAISENKSAIYLVPEISLTPQVLKIFRERFKDNVAILHSGLSAGEKFDEWRKIKNGLVKVVIGARSAIFAPLSEVGIIIVDEEHDSSYVSESNPRYATIDVAKFRAEYNNCKVIIGSATPSVESFYQAQLKNYELVTMSSRVNDKKMPELEIVDMSQELKNGNKELFSMKLAENLIENYKKGNQSIIFINRRGYSSFVMCKDCGYIANCSECDVSLTYHQKEEQLKCHYCGKKFHMLTNCPECSGKNLRYGKTGTEKVVYEIKKMIPDAKVLRMDNDTTEKKDSYIKILSDFKQRKADILVGTQMIAKGHNFPDVTLVGILDADMSLYFNDYRSNERTFQLITQVSGRAGRAEKEGRVVLQTFSPKHYVFGYAKNTNYLGFYSREINAREVAKFPPYTTILRVLITSEDEKKAFEVTKEIFYKLKEEFKCFGGDLIYLQAMKSPLTRIENKFRYQILLRANRKIEDELSNITHTIADNVNLKGVWKFIEINPQNLY